MGLDMTGLSPQPAPPLSPPTSHQGPVTFGFYPYPPPAPNQTCELEGVTFDFNAGARLAIQRAIAPPWIVRMKDMRTGELMADQPMGSGMMFNPRNWFVPIRFEIEEAGKVIWTHSYDAKGKPVAIHFPVGTLGDILAWVPYVLAFHDEHQCDLTVTMSDLIIPLLAPAFPDIRFLTQEEYAALRLADKAYASYYLGLFFDDSAEHRHQPVDFRQVGLHKTAAYILGVPAFEQGCWLGAAGLHYLGKRQIKDKYIVIATHSTSAAKHWNNPGEWEKVVAWAKGMGYRVICIDRERRFTRGYLSYPIPEGAEDQTGDRPLTERANWIAYAEAFVGLSSGLAWLANALGTPTVLISGFTLPFNEFETPYRVINFNACNGCWNDTSERFDHNDFFWCPRHKGTVKQWECTTRITSQHVIDKLSEALDVGRD
jgi:autotransporter strand-loop-strand O-heptosyltransferase